MKPTVKRCPTCGSRFFLDEPNQLLCVPCQNAQDQPKRTQNYIAELQGRVRYNANHATWRGFGGES
jgi:hypothetical protein